MTSPARPRIALPVTTPFPAVPRPTLRPQPARIRPRSPTPGWDACAAAARTAAAFAFQDMGDGSALFTKALGLETDLTARGMGVRSQRYSMLVDDGVVKTLNLEAPGKFEVSGADKILAQL